MYNVDMYRLIALLVGSIVLKLKNDFEYLHSL